MAQDIRIERGQSFEFPVPPSLAPTSADLTITQSNNP